MYRTKLEKILEDRYINKSAFARKIGIKCRSTLAHWVSGKNPVPARYMTKIADELGMTEQDIFFDKEFNMQVEGCKKNAITES